MVMYVCVCVCVCVCVRVRGDVFYVMREEGEERSGEWKGRGE